MTELEDILAAGGLMRGCDGLNEPVWGLDRLAGILTELSGQRSGVMTTAVDLLYQAQQRQEPCAWLTTGRESFYPPDLDGAGIDLAALAVVRVATPVDAAERLLRSGGFGLLVVDCPWGRLPTALLKRLAVQARRQQAAVVFLTRKEPGAASLGGLVGLHLQVTRDAVDGRWRCRATAQKDRRRGGAWQHTEWCDGPPGLC